MITLLKISTIKKKNMQFILEYMANKGPGGMD
jgi:hypothetical protein